MAVITVSRQMGSLGCQVAEEIARCLGYRVVWREVINEAAKRAGVPEVALAAIDELNLLGIKPSEDALEAYHNAVREILHELNQQDNAVIVGRAGQVILREEDNVLHVRVFAPLELRALRTAQTHRIKLEVARRQVKTSDQARVRYLKRYYQTRWDDPELYDILVNTAHLGVTAAAQIVCTGLQQRQHHPEKPGGEDQD